MNTTSINTETRGGRMLDALVRAGNRNAKVVVTVDLVREDGKRYHQPIRFKAYDSRRGRNAGCRMLAADLMDGDWSAGTHSTKVLEWNLDRRDERPGWNGGQKYEDALVIYAARAAFEYLRTGRAPQPANGSVEIAEREFCGCCGRQLDRRESIELGVGPECARKVGLQHHYRSSQLAATRGPRPAQPTEQPHQQEIAPEHSLADHLRGIAGRYVVQVGDAKVDTLLDSAAAINRASELYDGVTPVTVYDDLSGQMVVQYDP